MSSLADREQRFFDEFWKNRSKPGEFQGVLQIPGMPALAGARVLVCSCGSGVEPVLAAKAGADVYAFDVSPVAVEKARESARLNEVKVAVDVMDFHSLSYADGFFDVVYGSAILHHVDCGRVGREILRVLKPGGVAFFWENSDRNPILRWFRRRIFGAPGGPQRQKALIFRREGTTDEYPLTEAEVALLSQVFSGNLRRVYRKFEFFRMVSYLVGKNSRAFGRLTEMLDELTVRLVPAVMPYSFHQGLLLRKPPIGGV